ncbi:hypothetical protein HNH97_14190, partial [Gluconacetobacter entanii]|nr:hypothetical protein [Gluconacetobacter entanii]
MARRLSRLSVIAPLALACVLPSRRGAWAQDAAPVATVSPAPATPPS